jgi:uncharacterized membrane protein YozB (DUF420 family)
MTDILFGNNMPKSEQNELKYCLYLIFNTLSVLIKKFSFYFLLINSMHCGIFTQNGEIHINYIIRCLISKFLMFVILFVHFTF